MPRHEHLQYGALCLATLLLGSLASGHRLPLEAAPALDAALEDEVPAPIDLPEPDVAPPPSVVEPPKPRRLAIKPPPAPPPPPLEIDLELDPTEKVLDAIVRHPRELEQARKDGGDLLLAYGYALRRAGRYSESLQPLLTYHDAKGRLATYAALLLGESLLELNQYDEAARWFTEARDGFPAGERQVQARYGLARVLQARGDAAQAIHELEQLLNDAPRSIRRHEIKLRLARAYEQSGQIDQAITNYEWLWAWVPAMPEAEAAGREISRLQEARAEGYAGPNTAVRYRRALRLLASGQVEPGLSLMLSLAQDSAVVAALPRSFTFELGKAYFLAKQYTEAAEQLDSWYSRTRGNERAEALFWRALTQGRLARFDESVALYRQLAREFPRSGLTETAMYKIGLLRLDQGDYPAAEEAFAAYRERFPKAGQADNAQWYVAWAQLRQGRYAAAQASYEELLRRYPRTSLVPGVRYWQGRMAQVQGDTPQAIACYRQVLQSPIASHYAPLAEARLKALNVALEAPPADQPPESAPALELPHPELLERINGLMALGLRTWAQEELAAYEHSLRSRDELLALADWYRRTGNFGGARLITANLGVGEGVPKIRDPGLTWQLSYPLAFQDQLKRVNLPKKVPWELVYAIMRQESEFKPWITSRVGARGLMQVMPETANEVCQSRKQSPPALNTLYRPEVCVQYGAWHLEDLMNRLGGRLPLVIAAYNASPEAVERWMKEKPVDPIDVFIEEISYSETRRYVKKVLTNLWIYRRLHADGRTPLMNEPGMDRPIVASKAKRRAAVPADQPVTSSEAAPEGVE
jgi:soluble lytic murein transglycosylase